MCDAASERLVVELASSTVLLSESAMRDDGQNHEGYLVHNPARWLEGGREEEKLQQRRGSGGGVINSYYYFCNNG